MLCAGARSGGSCRWPSPSSLPVLPRGACARTARSLTRRSSVRRPDVDNVTGVEIARSAPSTIYVTMTSGPTFMRKVARTTNGGAHWDVSDLTAVLGTGSIRLVAVDPQNPMRIYLRLGGGSGDRLAV